ncbi:hypothetical protein VTK73DRAFT_4381 [Phialemonium thermophilum]|uniref:Conserved oligomeric Golgi complex subunit 6 n=1 Tax=Phialemonium thermophilum TaxID=223376 RepID=A0ABR3Y0T6_9PEZI
MASNSLDPLSSWSPLGSSTTNSLSSIQGQPASLRAVHPLASKISSVLSTSYTDSEFQDVLVLLDDRGVLNRPKTRQRLRLDIQKELISSNGEIVVEFARVSEQMQAISTSINCLNATYNGIRSEVTAAREATSRTIDEALTLMAEKRQLETKQQLLTSLTEHFVIPEAEMDVLTATSEPVDDRFFDILSKVKKILNDCELLLGFEPQTLGLEVIEHTSRLLNQAFQKLHRWIQQEFRNLNLENPQIGSPIRRALRILAERPSLFQSCLDFFSDTRENVLSEAFFAALTGEPHSGGENSSVKPIEMAAHDPLRYVGDMLAWTHSAAVGEKEALEVLFISEGDDMAKSIRAGRENEIWRLVADERDEPTGFDAATALNDLVDRDMSGAARILRQRVEQVVQTNEDIILAYKLANLIGFYRSTFARLLGNESVLLDILSKLESEALRQFRALMRDHIALLQGEFQHTPADLGPPEFLQDALGRLTAIMRTYETSFTSSADLEADFKPVLAEAFDPFIEGCEQMGKTISFPASSLFIVNCIEAARCCLAPFDFVRSKAEELDKKLRLETQKLVDSQYKYFRAESGLQSLMDALDHLTTSPEDLHKVRSLDPVQPARLVEASQILDVFLPSALMDALENLQHLRNSRLARDITEEAAERFCVDYEHVEELLILADDLAEGDDDNSDAAQNLRALFPRTTGELRVLLS